MPPRVLQLSRNGNATLTRLGFALALVGLVGLAMVIVAALSAFTATTGSDMLIFLLMLSPLIAIAGYVTWLTLRPMQLLVHGDALEVRHPRMLRRPLVIPRANVRAVHLDDGTAAGAARFPTGRDDEPFLWANRWLTIRRPGRPVIGDGVLPNVAVELVDSITIDQARDSWLAACHRGEPEPPPRDEPVDVVMLAVKDPDAAQQALAGWGVRRPAPTPALVAPGLRPGQREQRDTLLVFLASAVPVPFYMAGLWQIIPVHVLLVGLAGSRLVMRSRGELAAARDAAASQPPGSRAAAAAAAEANFGPPPAG